MPDTSLDWQAAAEDYEKKLQALLKAHDAEGFHLVSTGWGLSEKSLKRALFGFWGIFHSHAMELCFAGFCEGLTSEAWRSSWLLLSWQRGRARAWQRVAVAARCFVTWPSSRPHAL